MIVRLALLTAFTLIFILISGRSGPTFANLRDGTGVPAESIDSYAAANGISRDETGQRMVEELNRATGRSTEVIVPTTGRFSRGLSDNS